MLVAQKQSATKRVRHQLLVGAGAWAVSMLCFLVLPILQAISEKPQADVIIRSAETGNVDPPPPEPEKPQEEEEQQEEDAPELESDAPLSLEELTLTLSGGGGNFMSGAGLGLKLKSLTSSRGKGKEIFSLTDLDEKPRVLYREDPVLSQRARRATPGNVVLDFRVDEQGRVRDPVVYRASNPMLTAPALNAIRKWKFQAGKRQGKKVSFRIRQQLNFPKS